MIFVQQGDVLPHPSRSQRHSVMSTIHDAFYLVVPGRMIRLISMMQGMQGVWREKMVLDVVSGG